LNEEDPLLLDKLKIEAKEKRQEAITEARSKMSPEELRKIEKKKKKEFRKREFMRARAEIEAKEREMQEAREAQQLAEFQRLAAGGGPETLKET